RQSRAGGGGSLLRSAGVGRDTQAFLADRCSVCSFSFSSSSSSPRSSPARVRAAAAASGGCSAWAAAGAVASGAVGGAAAGEGGADFRAEEDHLGAAALAEAGDGSQRIPFANRSRPHCRGD